MKRSFPYFVLAAFLFGSFTLSGQEGEGNSNPYVSYEVPFQNLLKFNRFLVNPTFSTVRENKSYINFFHRNQAAGFDDNHQDYFLSYSGRIDDRSGLGFSLYNQREGVITNIGAMANYAYGVRLSENSVLTFAMNIPYYHSSFDRTRAVTAQEDPLLNDLEESAIIAFQPGVNLAIGKFDVGLFAENMLDYNLKAGELMTAFPEKTFSAHLQYTQELGSTGGIFEQARLMPLLRLRKVGQAEMNYGGGMIMDLPKLGWLQGGYDSYYGASVGAGFNLSRRLSLGYTIEKGLANRMDNFGTTHEISLAFSFTPNLTENYVQNDEPPVLEKKEFIQVPAEGDYAALLQKYEALEEKYEQTNQMLDELMFRQDSIEKTQLAQAEKRYEMMVRTLKREMQDQHLENADALVENHLEKTEVPAPGAADDRSARFADPRDLIVRTMPKVPGIEEGHYVVANVFSTEKYLKKFMNDLQAQGLQPKHFRNPENGLHYVYLAHYDEDAPARQAYLTGLDGQYRERTWIMHVEASRYANMAKLEFEDE